MHNEQLGEKSEEISRLLQEWRAGNAEAGHHLMEAMYDDLRQLAGVYMRRERQNHTLQPTALVHEVYLRLFAGSAASFEDRNHLLAVAARQLRRVLVNHARDLHALKRGGDAIKLSLDDVHAFGQQPQDVLDLHMALEHLAELDARSAEVVELRYFGGLSDTETAEALQVSVATVKRDWNFARTWLLRRLTKTS